MKSNRRSARANRAVPDDQLRQFISHMDALTERLRPERRPLDRNEPECSQQELKALAALGDRDVLTMSDLAGILSVPLSTATHTIDKLVAKNLVARKRVQQDRRIVQVSFSRRGRRIHQFVLESRLGVGRAVLGTLNPRDRNAFLQQLKSVILRLKGSPLDHV
jgi:DNA-binding MarR family transcriptional regulator